MLPICQKRTTLQIVKGNNSRSENQKEKKTMSTKQIIKAQINQTALDLVKAKFDDYQAKIIQDLIQSMNDMVNFIEHSGRVETTKDFYGDYLPLIRTKSEFALYILAGAGEGARAVARINNFE